MGGTSICNHHTRAMNCYHEPGVRPILESRDSEKYAARGIKPEAGLRSAGWLLQYPEGYSLWALYLTSPQSIQDQEFFLSLNTLKPLLTIHPQASWRPRPLRPT